MRIVRFAVWCLLPALAIGAGQTAMAAAPTLTSVAPTTGETSGGEAVTLTGTGFVSGCTVAFGSVAAPSVTVGSSTTITATTPEHAAGTVAVSVTCPDGTATLNDAFTFLAPASGAGSGNLWFDAICTGQSPRILLEAAGPVTITARIPEAAGNAFDLALVDANGATVASWHLDFPGRTSRTVRSPSVPAGTYELRLSGQTGARMLRLRTSASHFVWPNCTRFRGGPGGTSGVYYFYAPPHTTSFTFRVQIVYNSNCGGWSVAIYAPDGSRRTTIGDGIPCYWDDYRVVSVEPASAGAFWSVELRDDTVSIEPSIENVPSFLAESPAAWFEPDGLKAPTYVDLDVSPPSAATGETVTFTAAMAPQSATGTVAFLVDGSPLTTVPVAGGVASTTTSFTSAALHEVRADYSGDTVRAPSTATGAVVMLPPALTSISPPNGSNTGGDRVTLTGTNFAADCTVAFGGIAAQSIEVNGSTTMTATTPQHDEATVDISVTCPSGGTVLANAYTFLAPPLGAGTGNLWSFTGGGGWRILLENREPVRITLDLSADTHAGMVDLSIVDAKGVTVFSRHIDYPPGASQKTLATPPLEAGIYSVQRSGGGPEHIARMRTSASRFILPPRPGFFHDDRGTTTKGTYYFYVPRDTSAFTSRLWVQRGRNLARAITLVSTVTNRDPDGIERGRAFVSALDSMGKLTVDVDSASSGAFWSADLLLCWCQTWIQLEGVPPIFADSPSAWFEPAADGEHAQTYVNLDVSLPASERSNATRGANVLATASVVPAPAAGNITFLVDGQAAGTVSLTGGQASLSLTLTTAGLHTIKAAYSGNGVWSPSDASETITITSQHGTPIPLLSYEAMLLLIIALAAAALWAMKR